MKVLLVFEKGFPIDKGSLEAFLKHSAKHINFTIQKSDHTFNNGLISKPYSFQQAYEKIKGTKKFDKIFCFTKRQYKDNYFFHEYKDMTIFSFYGWEYLTNLPIENGTIFFIIDYIALHLDGSFRHQEITGCVYDFRADKRGIDDGMRQCGFCAKCLQRLSDGLEEKESQNLFTDLKCLMNRLAEASKWNTNVLSNADPSADPVSKRKPKNKNGIHITIASPGDTAAERKMLLDSLERRFRVDKHESNCGRRIIVHGWEDLASQPGYAQDVINKKIISESDFIVAVFKQKLGTPTKNPKTGAKRAESGTVEELLQGLDNSKTSQPIGMAYFFSKAPIISLDSSEKDVIEKEWKRLRDFKNSIKDRIIYKPYNDENELLSMVLMDLDKNICDFIQK